MKPDGHQLVTRVNQAFGLHQAGRLDAAVAAYRQILEMAPKHAAVLAMLGAAEAQRGNLIGALPVLEAARKADSHNPDVHHNLGMVLLGLGRPADALEHLRKVIALRPNEPGGHFGLGNALAQLARFGEAERAYKAALRVAPGHLDARNNLGNVLIELGRPEAALDAYEAVLRRHSGHALALAGRARALELLGRDGQADGHAPRG
jgi:tetratricopeptide (TPR) repeat protein